MYKQTPQTPRQGGGGGVPPPPPPPNLSCELEKTETNQKQNNWKRQKELELYNLQLEI